MSTLMDEEIKRWTAKRKTALVLEIIQGKTSVAEASRAHDLQPSEIEVWWRMAERHGERSEGEPTGPVRAVRASAQRAAGGLRRSDAGAARQKKLQSLLDEDEK
ncbi:MAG TPA: DUF1153 domain-containing protein [Rhodocyclaceae bacterium]|nr:DUF1153 domain-containing protein [Rhodocyclaceae bacterium]